MMAYIVGKNTITLKSQDCLLPFSTMSYTFTLLHKCHVVSYFISNIKKRSSTMTCPILIIKASFNLTAFVATRLIVLNHSQSKRHIISSYKRPLDCRYCVLYGTRLISKAADAKVFQTSQSGKNKWNFEKFGRCGGKKNFKERFDEE